MPKLKALSSLTLVLSDVTIAFVLTLFLSALAPDIEALGSLGFIVLFVVMSSFVALVTVVSLSFAKPNAAAKRVIAARDLAIYLREQALNEHTIVSVSHPDGTIAAVNQNFVEKLGYAPEEVIGKMPSMIYWNDDGEFERVRDVVSRGQIWKGHQRLRAKDGHCVTVETTILPRFDDNGHFENSISIRTDLSGAMADGAEEGRNAVVEGLPDEVYIYDPETFRLRYANANGRRRLRRTLDELRGMNLTDFFTVQETTRFKRHIGPVLSGETDIARLEIENAAGPVEVLTHLDRGPNGRRSLVSVVRSIEERRAAEAIKLTSVATVSHELRTPLTSIKGALRLMESGVVGALSPEAARMVTVARRNSDRLLAIVNDILVLEKLSSGEMEMSRRPVDLRELLSEAAEANAAFAAQCEVRFVVEGMREPAWVHGDPDRLMQVLANLMSNAAKFSPAGSGILLRIVDRGETWRVCVEDRGPGIPEEARQTLFDSFTQVSGVDAKSQQGTGLGLAICKEIVARHDGHIAFETEVGKGSTFYFELEKLDRIGSASERPAASVA
ncbi:PAS domain-containing sensor histidine kinase [Roseibacterium sp. SDUM158016]|jgi:two-component system sensor histidine kinase VicK|uniref:PAS domain-containing sensor histidine kinase n=1 Tax=Roseicyclus sediminis TaxID=2980997 RepID=UPI0021D05D84|nr:PAS domain-containing sensor histidine kinase [Roseibacterium sp. SDUM158016]MCU4651573.1 PAS domain-containing sensor histidine kinase [Roseibacterium sp. SDUM158016]